MKLSIIVPVYKVRDYLSRCIESILEQMVSDYELILVDDGCPEGCGAICDTYAQNYPQVRVIHKSNGGLSSARNAGLELAKGEYVTFVDSDDTVMPNTYAENMRILLADPEIEILEYPVYEYYDGPRSKFRTFSPRKVSGSTVFQDWVRHKGYEHAYAWNKIYKRHLFHSLRYPEGENFEDIFLTPKLYERCKCAYYSNMGGYYYFDHAGSISNTPSFEGISQLFRNRVRLYEMVKKQYGMHAESYYILTQAIDSLTDLGKFRPKRESDYLQACKLLEKERLPLGAIITMKVPLKRKLKFIIATIFGINAHCRMVALLKK